MNIVSSSGDLELRKRQHGHLGQHERSVAGWNGGWDSVGFSTDVVGFF